MDYVQIWRAIKKRLCQNTLREGRRRRQNVQYSGARPDCGFRGARGLATVLQKKNT